MTNLVHGFIYFAPEASEEFDALGLPADHHYFASRGAALGPVSAEVIVATFYNFNPALVAAVIPAAWSFVDPTEIQQARTRAAGRALRRVEPDLDAELLGGHDAGFRLEVRRGDDAPDARRRDQAVAPVSYTHLTLPTILLV